MLCNYLCYVRACTTIFRRRQTRKCIFIQFYLYVSHASFHDGKRLFLFFIIKAVVWRFYKKEIHSTSSAWFNVVFSKIFNWGGRNLIGIIDFYWFLKSVFFCYIITFIAIKVIKREKVAFCFLILISLLVNLDISTYMLNYMLPCFILGSIINRHIHFFMNYKIVLLSISIFLYILMLPYWEFS